MRRLSVNAISKVKNAIISGLFAINMTFNLYVHDNRIQESFNLIIVISKRGVVLCHCLNCTTDSYNS